MAITRIRLDFANSDCIKLNHTLKRMWVQNKTSLRMTNSKALNQLQRSYFLISVHKSNLFDEIQNDSHQLESSIKKWNRTDCEINVSFVFVTRHQSNCGIDRNHNHMKLIVIKMGTLLTKRNNKPWIYQWAATIKDGHKNNEGGRSEINKTRESLNNIIICRMQQKPNRNWARHKLALANERETDTHTA